MEQQKNNLVCPICQHQNVPGARRCAQCGVSLMGNTTTMRVSDEQIDEVMQELDFAPPVHRDAVAEGLVFYIAGEVQPVIVRGRDEVTLGRHVEESPPPPDLVDLGTYHGHLLGVSRQHARVKLNGDECLLEDLNSTNGTWLNEKRLTSGTAYILNNGDQVRLGQLILFVYFSMTSTRQKVTLKLSGSAAAVLPRPPIMGLHLAIEATHYMRALVDLQQAIDEIQGRNTDEKRDIPLLEVDGEQASVGLTLVGLADAVNVVQQVIMPWQQEHVWLLAALWKGAAPAEALAIELPSPGVPVPDTSPLGGLAEGAPLAEDPAALDESAVQAVTSDLTAPEPEPSQTGVLEGQGAVPEAEPEAEGEEAPPEPADDDTAAEIEPENLLTTEAAVEIEIDAAAAELEETGQVDEEAQPVEQITLDTLALALQRQVLEHVAAGFGATASRDRGHLILLKNPVEVLSRSILEVATSSY
ncbi:MAG: FHA domain-containing protein [Anaerolineae bacterium]|nr:FHA domain-containing protein [Anaerolineae bacterium]